MITLKRMKSNERYCCRNEYGEACYFLQTPKENRPECCIMTESHAKKCKININECIDSDCVYIRTNKERKNDK